MSEKSESEKKSELEKIAKAIALTKNWMSGFLGIPETAFEVVHTETDGTSVTLRTEGLLDVASTLDKFHPLTQEGYQLVPRPNQQYLLAYRGSSDQLEIYVQPNPEDGYTNITMVRSQKPIRESVGKMRFSLS